MTIFTILKYPLSHPPTEEELRNLPKTIYDKWCREVIASVPNVPPHESISSTFKSLYRQNDQDNYQQLRCSLTKVIEQYEEPVG